MEAFLIIIEINTNQIIRAALYKKVAFLKTALGEYHRTIEGLTVTINKHAHITKPYSQFLWTNKVDLTAK